MIAILAAALLASTGPTTLRPKVAEKELAEAKLIAVTVEKAIKDSLILRIFVAMPKADVNTKTTEPGYVGYIALVADSKDAKKKTYGGNVELTPAHLELIAAA